MKLLAKTLIVIMLSLLCITDSFAETAAKQTIRIAAFNFYPSIFKANDGTIQGFYVDFLKEIANRENWDIEYVYGSWSEGIDRIKNGEVDVLTGVAFTSERALFMDYAKTQLLTVWAELYVPDNSEIDSIRQVKDKRIALMKGDFNAANFRNLVEKFHIPCTFVEYASFEEVFKAVSARQVDGGVVNNTFGAAKQREYSIRSSGVIFNPFDIYFTVAKDKNRDIIMTLDRYLAEWRKDDSSPYHVALERWAHGSAAATRVTPAWLIRSLTLFVAGSCVAVAFIVMLRIQVRRKTSELKAEIIKRVEIADELHLSTVQLEEELAERQMAQEQLQEQAAILEEEITERYRIEETLLTSQQRYQLLFENMTTGFALHEMIYDEAGAPVDYRFLEVNPAFEKLTGTSAASLIGKTVMSVMPETEPYWIERFGTVAQTGEPLFYEDYSKSIDKYFDCWAFSPGKNLFAVIFSDVTERRKAEEEREKLKTQLLQAQKLDTVGRLAGGIAHDFNNKLSVIIGYAELSQLMECQNDRRCGDNIKEIIKAARHSQEITRRLLTFSRSDNANPIKLDLNIILSETQKTLGRMIGENIILNIDLQKNLWPVRIDPTQFDQVITNLVVNARDAMPEGGTVTISTGNISIGSNHPQATPGDYVSITCTDSGCGMEAGILEQIFEPFFTTKDVDKGTGLGLSSVYGIVRQNNGFVSVTSEPGRGSVFTLLLPRLTETAAEDIKESVDSAVKGLGSILLVEDEEPVRKITKLMLEYMGYTIIDAESPEKALSICDDPTVIIDCVLSDVIMPGMNGKVLQDHINAIRPNLPYVFMSGYTPEIINEQFKSTEGIQFVQKPINYKLLHEKISSLVR